MWRIKLLTELFGPCGVGWYYEIDRQWTEPGANGETAAFCNISLYIRLNGEWSKPIKGTGGSMFAASERSGLYTSDECFKMALTDAISVACKALGFAADVYWNADRTKYDQQREPPRRINQGTMADIEDLIAQTGSDLPKLLAYFKVARLEDMRIDQARKCMVLLQKKLNG